MVEKIDKPEPPPTYFIQATTETKGDRKGSGQEQRESDEYSGSHAAPGWQKIYASAANRRYLKVRREDVVRAWLRGTIMQRGISLVEADIEFKNGRILKGVHIILPTREDFWTLKRFHPGQDIPLNMIIKEPILEISVPMPGPAVPPDGKRGEAVLQEKGEKIDVKNIIVYAAIGAAILLLMIFVVIR